MRFRFPDHAYLKAATLDIKMVFSVIFFFFFCRFPSPVPPFLSRDEKHGCFHLMLVLLLGCIPAISYQSHIGTFLVPYLCKTHAAKANRNRIVYLSNALLIIIHQGLSLWKSCRFRIKNPGLRWFWSATSSITSQG